MLRTNGVPSCIKISMILPILKKPSLNANKPEHYRAIAPSSIFTNLFQSYMLPTYVFNGEQFVFRRGCGTAHVITMMNNIISHLNTLDHPYTFLFRFIMA